MSSLAKWCCTVMVLTTILLIFIGVVSCELKQGDSCVVEKNGSKGTCKFLTACTSLLQLLQSGRAGFPQRCSIENSQFVVCCEDQGNLTSDTSMGETKSGFSSVDMPPQVILRVSPEVNDSSKDHPPSRKPGTVSQQKCIEYAELAWDVKYPETLSLLAEKTRILECVSEKIPLIKGGTKAEKNEFPHMAALGYQRDSNQEIDWKCGGTLISKRYVLTAAHCLSSREFGVVKRVRLGVTRLTEKGSQDIDVMQIFSHPLYSRDRYHDIGLLKLVSNVDMTPFIRPACLYTTKDFPYQNAIATGFGQINDTVYSSKDLLKVVLELFDNTQCNETYRSLIKSPGSALKNGVIEDMMVCAGSRKELKDTCRGDSGGPLQIYHEETEDIRCMYDIIGITSFGQGCGLSVNHPGVYTRVSHYIKWIEDIVWPEGGDE